MSSIIKLNTKSGKLNVQVKDENNPSGDGIENPQVAALQKHYERGFEEGYNAAREELENGFNEKIINKFYYFDSVLQKVNAALMDLEKHFELITIKTAVTMAEKIINREVKLESIINDVLTTSLKKIIGANNIVVKINPEDIAWLSATDNNFVKEELMTRVKFEEDENIEPGGCIVESEIGNVDARISSQLNELKKYLEAAIEDKNV